MNKIYKFILGIGAALALASCSTPTNIPYFQDVTNGSTDSIAVSKTIRIRPGDKVSIIVNSDGSGDAGESSEIDIELKKSGDAPTSYTYSAA